MKKSELNPSIRFKDGNVKLKQCFITFALLAGETCIGKTNLCYKNCFGRRGCFAMPTNRQCYNKNYLETLKDTFIKDTIDILEYQLQRKKFNEITNLFVRIHSTGDFYSKEYFNKWIKITNYFKGNNKIKFQAYTKSLSIIDSIDNINIQLIFSQMPDTKQEDIDKAKKLGMKIYNTLEMKIDDFEEFTKTTKDHICSGECEKCLSCYLGLHDITINRLRKNGEPSKYKNKNLDAFNLKNDENVLMKNKNDNKQII
jgi:hypothetical protein